MTLTATVGIPGASVGDHSIPTMWSEFMEDHRRLPMPRPLLPSLEFLLCNPNPIFPSPDLEVYPAHYNIIFKNSKKRDHALYGEDRVVDKWQLVVRKVRASHLLLGVVLVSFLGAVRAPTWRSRTPTCLLVRVWGPPGVRLWGSPPVPTILGRVRPSAVYWGPPWVAWLEKPMGARSPPLSPVISRRRPGLIIRGRLRLVIRLHNRALTMGLPLRAIDCRPRRFA